jgi:hypothetical protein
VPKPVTEKTVEQILKETDLKKLIDELTRYAYWKLHKWRFVFRTRSADMAAESMGAKDFVSMAFEFVLDENSTRKWNRERYPILEVFMKSIIDSLFSNLAAKKDNQILENFDQLLNGDMISARSKIHQKTPEEIMIAEETESEADEVLNQLMAGAESDPEFESFISFYFEGTWKLREIAEKMGIDEKRGYLLSRKLGRKIDKIIKSIHKQSEERMGH